jgi:hypothetical protein
MVIILIRTVKYNLSKLRVCFKVLSLLIHVQIVAVSHIRLPWLMFWKLLNPVDF